MDYMDHIDEISDIAQIVQGFEIFDILISNESDGERLFSQFREKKLNWIHSDLGVEKEWSVEYYEDLITHNISNDYSNFQCELNIIIPLQLLKSQFMEAKERSEDAEPILSRIKCFWEALNRNNSIASSYFDHVIPKVKIVFLNILLEAGVNFDF